MSIQGLGDLRVVDRSTGLAGAYATKLLADAGAEVVLVEPSGGSPLRRTSSTGEVPPGEDGALFRFLHTSKVSVCDPDPATWDALVEDADIVVDGGDLEIERLRVANPRLVVVSVTPWGRTGPWAGRPATHFTVEAASGSLLYRGAPDEVPYQAGGRIGEWTTGCYAAAAAAAAATHARRTGEGAHVDCSMLEVMAVANSVFADMLHSMFGRPARTGPCRSPETPSIERALDGWIGFNTNSGQMFQSFLLLIERFDLLDDPDWSNAGFRARNIEAWQAIVEPWVAAHSVEDILERCAELRIAAAPVHDGESILRDPHLDERGVFVPNPGGFLQPRTPYLVDGDVVRPFQPAPGVGDGPLPAGRDRPEPTGRGRRPFEGLRVLDVTSWWAGPSATALLAALGAEVVHVESTTHPDGMRTTGFIFGEENWWEWGHMFNAVNTNKLDLTLDLGQDRGRELLHELVAVSDLVVENFAPRVTERWGLTWDAVHALNPRAVLVRMPAFGLTGPWRDRVGFAQTMEQMSGMAAVTGHPENGPKILRGPCDPIAGMHAVVGIIAALEEARRTGEGRLVEATMVEAAINCAAEQIVEFSAYGRRTRRRGNRSPEAAPQGLYACRGVERWLALSIATDDQWSALRAVLGEPAWAGDPALDDAAGRHAAHDLLDEHLRTWAAARDVDQVVAELVSLGIPAVAAWDPRVASEHPQLVVRGLYEHVEHPVTGTHPVPGLPFRWTGVERWITSPTPLLGQHNREVLTQILGLTDAEVDELAAAEVIGTAVRT